MVSNEADIIEAFVRHNLRVLDALVVLDHASVDSTHSILQSLVEEGLPVVVLQDRGLAFHQGGRQSQMARRYLPELDADFSFTLDADEFIRSESRATLEASLARVPAGSCAVVEMQNYVGADAGSPPGANPARLLSRRLRQEPKPPHKVVLGRVFAAVPGSQVALGNHAALRPGNGQFQPFPHALLQDVRLAHFPVRSAEQVAKKALLGWLAHRLTKPERFLGPEVEGRVVPASHWRDLFTRLSEGRIAIDESLLGEATKIYLGGRRIEEIGSDEWVSDPIECPYELRYTPASAPTALAALATWADRLVSAVNSAPAGSGAAGREALL
jgi:hypothetical protein